MAKLRPCLTYANVMATVAVFVALGGTSYAVATGSIDSRELKNNSVRSKDIRNNDVRSKDVRNRSLLAKDFKAGQLPAGPRGASGPSGPRGPSGASGATNVVTRTKTGGAAGLESGTFATCNEGEKAAGGGVRPIEASGSAGVVADSYPSPSTSGAVPTAWQGNVRNVAGVGTVAAETHVLCASP